MQKRVQVRVLGPTTATVDGRGVEIASGRQRRLLAALALDVGSVVPADRLAERVWADGSLPADPRRALRTNLARLRQLLGDGEVIETMPGGWRLSADGADVDAAGFERLVREASSSDGTTQHRLALLDEALAMWGGHAFEDAPGEDWVAAEAARLEELRLTARERRYEIMIDAGLHTQALPDLAADADAHPLRDRLVRLRMLALHRSGRQAEAMRVFADHREQLIDLGLDPSDAVVELDRRIVAADPGLGRPADDGAVLRSYRLGDQLGEGAFAIVYRGTQPSVGREVAVKVIRAELANQPDFVRRFEVEANVVANLEHPYIVPLYDYWREPDRACLVFRYLRGGNLDARLSARGPLSLEECAAMVDQVGAALAAAHAAGVVHRDVKPANVFLDEVGNYYLGDFGIAVTGEELTDPTAVPSAGSPAYASPEQLRREVIGPPADVHGLGVSMYEALTGTLPFPDAGGQASLLHHQLHDAVPDIRLQRSDLPAGVDAVIQRATAKDPADRYQTLDELIADFHAAIDESPSVPVRSRGTATLVEVGDRNPYKGLRAFGEADAADFHGRAGVVERLAEGLTRTGTPGRIAAVVGPSGIGKSSVVRAGLIPRLRRGGVPDSESWFVATMLPGRDPFEELGAALVRVATTAPPHVFAELASDVRGIARVVKAVVPDDGTSEVLVVIDQFEELFTLVPPQETARFLDALQHAVTDARCPIRVVLTIRADFWDRPLRHGAFARLIEDSTVHLSALAPDELERAIVEPAAAVGATFEPGLVSRLVADVADEPGALPMLQYALTELFERRVSGMLMSSVYEDMGGISGALASRAEDLHEAAQVTEQEACRRVLRRLVSPGDGTEDTRRRALVSEVAETPATRAVVERFGEARLFSFDHDPVTREPTVEVAHEALIRSWPRLRAWLDEDRDAIRERQRLSDTVAAWRAAGEDPSELYRGGRLETAEALLDPAELTDAEADFLRRSVAQREEEADLEARRVRRLRRQVLVTAVVAILALVAGAIALTQWNRAEGEASEAEAARDEAIDQREVAQAAERRADLDRLRSSAVAESEANPALALLLATEAYRLDPGPASADALQRVLGVSGGLEATMPGPYGTLELLDEEGRTAVAVTIDAVEVWDLGTRQRVRTLDRPTKLFTGVAISADADLVAISDDAGTDLVEISTGRLVHHQDRPVDGMRWSPDGTQLAVRVGGGVELWSVDDPAAPTIVPGPVGLVDVAWHPDGERWFTVDGDGTISFSPVGDGDEPLWTAEKDEVLGIRDMLVTADLGTAVMTVVEADQFAVVALDLETGELIGEEFTHPNRIADLYWIDEDRLEIALAIQPGELAAVGLRDGLPVETPIASEVSWALEYSPGLDRIVEASALGLRLWRPEGVTALSRAVPLTPEQLGTDANARVEAALSADGSRVLTSVVSFPFPAVVDHDLRTGAVDALPFTGVVFGLGSHTLLVDREMVVLDEDLEPVGPGVPTPPDPRLFNLSADGSHFAVLRFNDELELYDSRDGFVGVVRVPGVESPEGGLGFSFSGDGSRMVATELGGNQRWAVFDTATAEVVLEGDPQILRWSGLAGEVLYGNGPGPDDHDILRLDPESLEPVGPALRGHTANLSWVFDNGTSPLILTGSFDRTARVWDRATGEQIGAELPLAGVLQASGDGHHVLTMTSEGPVVWNYDIESWPALACESAGRNMTPEEWADVGPRTIEYRATCPA